jgi:hypothetical protein
MNTSSYPRADRFFLVAFALFTLVAFVHEPLFYVYCGWDGLRDGSCQMTAVGRLWIAYAKTDPIYFDMPLWMALMIGFDTFVLSPFYVYCMYALWRGRVDTPLFRAIGFSVSGGLVYAMVLYITWEVLTAEQTGAQLLPVIAFNIPWGIVPLLLIIRLYLGMRNTSEATP